VFKDAVTDASGFRPLEVNVCDGCDWRLECVRATENITDLPIRYTMCNMVGWQIKRNQQKIHAIPMFTVAIDSEFVNIELEIREGDELGGIVKNIQNTLPNVSREQLREISEILLTTHLPNELIGSVDWIDHRMTLQKETVGLLFPEGTFSNIPISNKPDALSDSETVTGTGVGLTIGITTCKRLQFYLQTLTSIQNSDPSFLRFVRVLVVDDSSRYISF
jgi:hypothetical protein